MPEEKDKPGLPPLGGKTPIPPPLPTGATPSMPPPLPMGGAAGGPPPLPVGGMVGTPPPLPGGLPKLPPTLPPGGARGAMPPLPGGPIGGGLPGLPTSGLPSGLPVTGLPRLPAAGSTPPFPLPELPKPPLVSRPHSPPTTGGFSMPGGLPGSFAMPLFAGASPTPPAAPHGGAGYGSAPGGPADRAGDAQREMEKKVTELEKRLQEEREKVLLANLKSQEEATYAAKVETAIKEVQDKLRRDRRDAETEDTRLKLEAKIQELEQRLVQERETWVTTLKGQVRTREVQDKEVESHFTMRIQEMERRWLEEKAHWQKAVLSREEEIRNLRALAEKLKGVELEYQRVSNEKKLIEERAAIQAGDLAGARGRLKALEDKDRECIQLKADLSSAREQARYAQEKLEHDLLSMRQNAKEREERLLSDNERLQREMQTIAERVRHETDLDVQKYKAEANMSHTALQKLRAVAGALERQAAALKVQVERGAKSRSELEQLNETYKSDFMALQQKWQEREGDLRRVMEDEVRVRLDAQAKEWQKAVDAETERARGSARQDVQTEIDRMQEEARTKIQEQRAEADRRLNESLAECEIRVREEMQRQALQQKQQLERNLGSDLEGLKQKLEEKEQETDNQARMLDNLRAALSKEQGARLESENALQQLRAQLSEVQAGLAGSRAQVAETEKLGRTLSARMEVLRKEAEEAKAAAEKEAEGRKQLAQEKAEQIAALAKLKEELRNVTDAWRREESSRHNLGAKAQALEAELREALAPKGLFKRVFGSSKPAAKSDSPSRQTPPSGPGAGR